MNVYRVRLTALSDHEYKRYWAAETLVEAADLAFKQWCEETGETGETGARDEFEQNRLQGIDFWGELENRLTSEQGSDDE